MATTKQAQTKSKSATKAPAKAVSPDTAAVDSTLAADIAADMAADTAKKPATKAKTTKAAKAKPAKAVKAKPAKDAPAKSVSTKDAPAQEAPAKDAPAKGRRTRWYVAQTQSNYEKRVQTHIREQAMISGLDKFIDEVLIPTEEVIEVKKGVKNKSERKFFPGYVLIKANMTDEVWHLIKGTNHVTGFVGAERGRKPLPISEREAERILNQMQEGVEKPRPLVNFEIGEEVRVSDGPFASFQGVVEEIDEDKSRLKVSVSIFGRATPIDLDFTQVEKG